MAGNRLLASLMSGSAIPVKRHGLSGAISNGNGGFDKTGIKVYYQFNEASGVLENKATTANGFSDGTGATNNSQTVGSSVVYGDSGIIGDSFGFNGTTNAYVDVGNDIISGTGVFSFNMWVYTTSKSGNQSALTGGNNQAVMTFQASTGKYILGNTPTLATTTNAPTNTWSMVSYSRSSGGDAKTYFNGSLENTGSNSTNIITGDWFIGGQVPSINEEWKGRIDECLVADIELSADQITELYNSGAGLDLLA